jgi:hypothetical protein
MDYMHLFAISIFLPSALVLSPISSTTAAKQIGAFIIVELHLIISPPANWMQSTPNVSFKRNTKMILF